MTGPLSRRVGVHTRFLISINRKGIGREYVPRWSGGRCCGSVQVCSIPGEEGDVAYFEEYGRRRGEVKLLKTGPRSRVGLS